MSWAPVPWKFYAILMGGHAKCLLLMTRGEGGGQKSQKPAYVIHGCSLKEAFFTDMKNFSFYLAKSFCTQKVFVWYMNSILGKSI